MKSSLVLGISLLLFTSCQSKAEPNTNIQDSAAVETVPVTPTAQVEQKETEGAESTEKWGDFWADFTAAVKQSDKAKLKNYCYAPSLSDQFFNNTFDNLFEGETREELLQVPPKDITVSQSESFEGLKSAKNVMEVFLSKSNYTLFFATVDGKYKLVYLFAAG